MISRLGVALLASAAVIAVTDETRASSGEAGPPSYDEVLDLLQQQQEMLIRQEEKLREQERRLERQQDSLDSLRRWVIAPDPGITDGSTDLRRVQFQPTPVPPRDEPAREEPPPEVRPAPPEPTAAPIPEAERPEPEVPQEQALVERGGVLLGQGALQLEPSIEYTHISSNRVAISGFTIFDAIVIGSIRVDDLKRDVVTAGMDARYGLTNRLQLEARVPYVYRRDSEVLGVGTTDQRDRKISGHGIGDIQASIAWQALDQSRWIPATVLRLRGTAPTGKNAFEIDRVTVGPGGETRLTEAPTGSGFYSVTPSSTFVWRADPAVFFAGLGYTRTFERDFAGFGTITPGDTFEWFGGINFSLTETVSVNASFVDQITFSTKRDGETVDATSANDARLQLGTSIGLGERTSLLVSAAAGLTDESPDFTFRVAVPINLQLF